MMLWFHGERIETRNSNAAAAKAPVLFVANRAGEMDVLAMLAAIPRPVLLADPQMIERLPMPLQFLLEPLLSASGEPAPGQQSVGLGSRVAQALADGFSVLAFADGPVATPASRCRFRVELFEAAAQLGMPVYPIFVENTAKLLQPADGARDKSTAATVVFGNPLYPETIADPVRCRVAVREALGELEKQKTSAG
jgi:1-acyl-sn-glycerol-3-phosphate acyltransferase